MIGGKHPPTRLAPQGYADYPLKPCLYNNFITILKITPAMKTFLIILRDAFIACAIFAVIGLIINGLRSDGLPFIADKPYEIFVPCPETLGNVENIAANSPLITDSQSFLIDARTPEEYNEWHLNNAMNITYDYLEPISEAELKNISLNIANSGIVRLIIYGDGNGEQGSSGYELGREIVGNGIKNVNVYVVTGGANALRGK